MAVAGSYFPKWDQQELPEAPVFRWRNRALLIGPGLMMAGQNIGGGEWLEKDAPGELKAAFAQPGHFAPRLVRQAACFSPAPDSRETCSTRPLLQTGKQEDVMPQSPGDLQEKAPALSRAVSGDRPDNPGGLSCPGPPPKLRRYRKIQYSVASHEHWE